MPEINLQEIIKNDMQNMQTFSDQQAVAPKIETKAPEIKVDAEVKPEVKTEVAPEVKPEVKLEAKTEDANGQAQTPDADTAFKELDKPWAAKTADEKAPVVVDPKDVKTLREELSKATETLKILEDPGIKAYLIAKAKGKTIFDIFDEAVKTPDVTKMSDEDVWKTELSLNKLSDEEIEDELKAWKEMSPLSRKREANKIRESLATKRNAELKEYADTAFASTADSQKKQADVATKSFNAYEALVDKHKGQKLFGVLEIDDSIANGVKDFYKNEELIPTKEDGTFDEGRMLEAAALLKYKDLIFENVARYAYKAAYDKFVSEHSVKNNPVVTSGSAGSTPTNLADIIAKDMAGFAQQK